MSLSEQSTKFEILSHISDAVMVVDGDFRIVFWNNAAARTFQIPAENALNKRIEDLFEAMNEAIAKEELRKIIENQGVWRGEVRSGTFKTYVEWAIAPCDLENGEKGFLIISSDINEKKQIELKLKKSEEKYRQLLECSPDPIFSFTPEGRYIYVNKAFADGVGKAVENIIDHAIWDVFSKDEADKRFAPLSQVFKTGEEKVIEVRVPRPDGDRFYVTTITPIKDETGTVTQAICSSKDITDRKKTSDSLLLFKELVEHSSDAIGMATPEKIHYYHNEEFDRLFDDIRGKPPKSLYVDQKIAEDVFAAISAGGEWSGEVKMFGKNKEVLDILLRAYSIKDKENRIIGLVGLHTNIAERKRVEQALKESEERYRNVVETQAELIARFLRDGTMVYVNRAWQEYYSRHLGIYENVIGKKFQDYLYVKNPAQIMAFLATIKPGDSTAKMERNFLSRIGENRWQTWQVHCIENSETLELEYQVVGIDITDQKRAEIALRENEAELRKAQQFSQMLFNASPVLIVAIGFDGRTIMMNRAMLDKLEYAYDEVIGADYLSTFVPEEDRRDLAGVFEKIVMERKDTVNENRIISKSGKVYLVEWHGRTAIQDVDTQPFFVGIGIDITERKQAETQLKESEERFRTFIDNSYDAVFIHDENGRVVGTNRTMLKIYNVTAEEALNFTIEDYSGPENDIEGVHLLWSKVLAGEEQFFTWQARRPKDGSCFDVEVYLTRIVIGNKPIILANVRDITERKRAERELRDSEERWQFALEGAGDGLWDWDAVKNKVHFSHQWKAMLGYEDHEIGDDLDEWSRRVHPDDLKAAYEDIYRHLNGENTVYQSEYRMRCKNGAYKWILDRGKVIEWTEEGKPLRVIGTHSDITERKLAEEIVADNEKMFRESVDILPMSCIIADLKGKVHYLNRNFTEVFGYAVSDVPTPEEWLHKAFPDENYRKFVEESWNIDIKRLLNPQEKMKPHLFRVTTKSKEVKVVEFRQAIIGERLIVLLNDITESHKPQEEEET